MIRSQSIRLFLRCKHAWLSTSVLISLGLSGGVNLTGMLRSLTSQLDIHAGEGQRGHTISYRQGIEALQARQYQYVKCAIKVTHVCMDRDEPLWPTLLRPVLGQELMHAGR